MRLASYFRTFRRLLFVAAVLLCVSPASGELSAGRSILEQARGDVARSGEFGIGALTLDNIYRFDFATAGIGTVIFRPRSNQFRPFVISQDLPRSVERWAVPSEPGSFINLINSNFVGSPRFFSGGGSFRMFDDPLPTEPLSPVIAVPETSTWVTAALALAAIAFTQRRRFRRGRLAPL